MVFTCLPDRKVLELLKEHEPVLGPYRVTAVEGAFDIQARSKNAAIHAWNRLACHLGKINHERGYISLVDTFGKAKRLSKADLKKVGLFDWPTIYFEERGAAHNLKLYIRRKKLAQKQFGSIIVRLEWTSTRSRAVKAHFAGDQLSDLISANLVTYFRKFAVFQQIDYRRLGWLLSPRTIMRPRTRNPAFSSARVITTGVATLFQDETYRAMRVAHLVIKVLEERAWSKDKRSSRVPEDIWRSSPAQIKGRFRAHIKKQQGSPKRNGVRRLRRRNLLTMRKLEDCFGPPRRHRVRL